MCSLFIPPIPVEDALKKVFPESNVIDGSKYIAEISSSAFIDELSIAMLNVRGRELTWELGRGWDIFLYAAVRLLRPSSVVETGVFDGVSSAIILQALEKNNRGFLVSVDLPAVDTIQNSTDRMPDNKLPKGCPPGWIIPKRFENRHKLILGDSSEVLPTIFDLLLEVDIFFHDSLHTEEHQKLEFELAYPHISVGGLLLSDDISWTPAFHNFCNGIQRPYINVCKDFGILRKI